MCGLICPRTAPACDVPSMQTHTHINTEMCVHTNNCCTADRHAGGATHWNHIVNVIKKCVACHCECLTALWLQIETINSVCHDFVVVGQCYKKHTTTTHAFFVGVEQWQWRRNNNSANCKMPR